MSAGRVSPISAQGSLMKLPKDAKPAKRKPIRLTERAYLALIRRLPCISCDTDPAGEAAHVRMCADDKALPGMGVKPDDRWALPLCHTCHMRQHAVGEVPFWQELRLNPLAICARLRASRGDLQTMRAVIFAAREKRK